jgi:transposase
MQKVIMVGCDLHDKTMLLKIGEGRQKPEKRSFANTEEGRKKMVKVLKERAQAAGTGRIVFAYEASGLGFGLYDGLSESGIECHVLAPTRIARSVKHRSNKTDEKDADQLLEIVRAHILAGNKLPSVWVPDHETRDDREVVRCRLDVGDKLTALKAQVRSLLKRNGVKKPSGLGKNWTAPFRAWLRGLSGPNGELRPGARAALRSLLRQMEGMQEEIKILDEEIAELSERVRYLEAAAVVRKRVGVGLLTAMVFLTEMGDLSRFSNRKQVGCYLGLAPSSNETGEQERKGHITHQGSPQVRKVLCQAAWNVVRHDPVEKVVYGRVAARNPKAKKIAVVACMRRLGIWMWHRGLEAQQAEGIFAPAEVRVACGG